MILSTCHPNRKLKAKGLCGSCYDKHLKSTNPTYKAAQVSNTTAWIQKHPEKRKQYLETRKLKESKDPDRRNKRKNEALKRGYGITLVEWLEIYHQQDGACALCFRAGDFTLHTDHNHTTGVIRGLLCHQCNWYLGTIEADLSILTRIQAYLGLA